MLPSRDYVVNHVLSQVDWDNCRSLIEYGPGVGTFTTHVLEKMRPDARLLALEVNGDFVKHLKRTIKDPRLTVIHRSATDVRQVLTEAGLHQVDCILSGIPFKTIGHHLRQEIVRTSHQVLRPGGVFLVYQLSTAVEPYLRETFPEVRPGVEPRSLIPSRTFCCRR